MQCLPIVVAEAAGVLDCVLERRGVRGACSARECHLPIKREEHVEQPCELVPDREASAEARQEHEFLHQCILGVPDEPQNPLVVHTTGVQLV